MKATMTTLVASLVTIGFGGGTPAAWAQMTTTPAPTPVTQTQTSGMVGLTTGQTARLNALNPGVPAPFATAALCSAQVSFLDDQGNVLKTESITVIPGKSVSFDLNRDKDVTASTGRLEIRATIGFPPLTGTISTTPPVTGSAVPVIYCSLTPTLEVFDNDTGKTQVVLTDFGRTGLSLVPAFRSGQFQPSTTVR
ncbi:MAG: hypothetical protein LAP40_26745 [Acidobacteriia bacterium]|nr:hypothetical protein [Terriglobia bacterium]